LNPHAFRRHPLKMVCLPVPPLPHFVNLTTSFCEVISHYRGFCIDSESSSTERPWTAASRGVFVAHRDLNVIVSRDILQREEVRALSSLKDDAGDALPHLRNMGLVGDSLKKMLKQTMM
jgi:hypothetical protein